MLLKPSFAFALLAIVAQQQQQPPVIRTAVEYVLIDVQVTGRDGKPIPGLKPEHFEVNIDGRVLPVVNAELINLEAGTPGVTPPAPSSSTIATVSAAPATDRLPGSDGRTIIIGVDQASLVTGSEVAAGEAVTRLLSMIDPRDAVGLVGYPAPGVSVAPTRDRQAVLNALKRISGQYQAPRGRVVVNVSDAVDWSSGDQQMRQRVFEKECGALNGTARQMCELQVEHAANEMVMTFQMQSTRAITGMQSLVEAVREYPGRKILVLVSPGFATSDRLGGRPDVSFEADMLGKRAAEANAVIYSLHLDLSFLMAYSAANAGRDLQTVFRNATMLARGLDRFTGSAGGSVLTVHANPEPALKRLLLETSAFYLLAVEPAPQHRDGRTHRITVKVKQGGTTVRSRASVVIPKGQ